MNASENMQATSISKARTIEEIADFWDTHSVADYWDQTTEVEFDVRGEDDAYLLDTQCKKSLDTMDRA
jgi:hypothetical protein